MGDALLTLPLLQNLRLAFPDAELDFYVRRGFAPLFAANPILRAVYEYDKRGAEKGLGALWRKGAEIRSRGYDLWVCAHSSARSAALARLSGAPLRVGYSGPWHDAAYNLKTPRRFAELEEVERLLQLLRPLDIQAHDLWPELVLPPEALKRADEYFTQQVRKDFSGPVLGLHPGSVWGTKRWPEENFAAIALRALQAGAQTLLFAGPGEEEMAARVARAVRDGMGEEALQGRFFDLSGKLSLPELGAWLGRLDCYLTNDSGPMHLAWMQRTPVTALFGPTVRSLGFFPRGACAQVFEAAVECRPCGLHGPQLCPKGHHACMREIDLEKVWADVNRKLFAKSQIKC